MKRFSGVLMLVLLTGSASGAVMEADDGPSGEPMIVKTIVPPDMMRMTPPVFEQGHSALNIPFTLRGNHVVIPLSINGSRPLDIILDTGMPIPEVGIMHRPLAEEIGLTFVENGPTIMVAGAGNGAMKEARRAEPVTVTLPGVKFENTRVSVTDFPELPDDGVIGQMIFGSCVVEIDYVRSVINLYDPEKYTAPKNAVALALQHLAPGLAPAVTVELATCGGAPVPVTLALDLGFSGSIDLHADPEKGLPVPGTTIRSILGTGLQGDIHGRYGRISRLKLESLIFDDLLGSFPDPEYKMNFMTDFGLQGILGNGILSRFTTTIDYSRDRLYLLPSEETYKPFEFNMAGLILRERSDGTQYVYHVLENTPGAGAGIAKADILVSVNGRDAAGMAPKELNQLFQTPDTSLELIMERSGERYTAHVKLQRLI